MAPLRSVALVLRNSSIALLLLATACGGGGGGPGIDYGTRDPNARNEYMVFAGPPTGLQVRTTDGVANYDVNAGGVVDVFQRLDATGRMIFFAGGDVHALTLADGTDTVLATGVFESPLTFFPESGMVVTRGTIDNTDLSWVALDGTETPLATDPDQDSFLLESGGRYVYSVSAMLGTANTLVSTTLTGGTVSLTPPEYEKRVLAVSTSGWLVYSNEISGSTVGNLRTVRVDGSASAELPGSELLSVFGDRVLHLDTNYGSVVSTALDGSSSTVLFAGSSTLTPESGSCNPYLADAPDPVLTNGVVLVRQDFSGELLGVPVVGGQPISYGLVAANMYACEVGNGQMLLQRDSPGDLDLVDLASGATLQTVVSGVLYPVIIGRSVLYETYGPNEWHLVSLDGGPEVTLLQGADSLVRWTAGGVIGFRATDPYHGDLVYQSLDGSPERPLATDIWATSPDIDSTALLGEWVLYFYHSGDPGTGTWQVATRHVSGGPEILLHGVEASAVPSLVTGFPEN